MELKELKVKIQKLDLPNFIAFTGEEWAVQKIYINQIAQVYKLEKRYMDSVYEIIPKLGNKSLFQHKDYLYVVRDDDKFIKDEKMWSRVEELLGQNRLILLITKPDKRLKFSSTYKNAITEFSALKPANLKKYIQKEISLSDKNCDLLIQICEGNYGRILLEIDKINNFMKYALDHNKAVDPDGCFRGLLEDGTIYIPPQDAIFDFVDAVLDRQVKRAFNLYEHCKGVNEKSFALMSVLFNNTKAVLQVQTCKSKDVAKSTGLTGWQITNAKKHIGKYTNKQLQNMLKLISDCVHGVKVGKIEEQFVIDYILVRVL